MFYVACYMNIGYIFIITYTKKLVKFFQLLPALSEAFRSLGKGKRSRRVKFFQLLLALSEALERLEKEDPKIADLIKLHYFVGLTLEQAGEILEISRRTAFRYWVYAKARLHEELKGQE